MTNSGSSEVAEAWNALWTDPKFDDLPFYIGALVVIGVLIIRLGGYHSGGGGGEGGGDGGC